MPRLLDSLSNRANQLRKAAEFPEFFSRWPQILAAEGWAKLAAPILGPQALMPPRSIVVRVTERCFLRCKFCAQGGERGRVDRRVVKDDFIGGETLALIGREAAEWVMRPLVMLTGGEPLLMWEELLGAVQEMRGRGLPVMFNTNGMLLQDRRIARRIVEADLNCLSISLDGGRDVHNRVRGNPGLFDAVMRGIENLHGCRAALGRKNPMIVITMVVASDTQHEIEKVYRIATARRADWFNLQFLNYTTPETCAQAQRYARSHFDAAAAPWPWASFCNPRFNDIDQDAVARQIAGIHAMRGPVPIYVLGGLASGGQIARYYRTLEPIRRSICALPFTAMHIVMPGKAVFCIDYPFYEYGDIRAEGLKSAWLGKPANDFRRELVRRYAEHKDNFPQCRRCCWRFT
jgi:MoaA/NifB/PqqE/SkfB family radical SAM enzyme